MTALILGVLHSLEPGGVERDMLRFADAWREQGFDARLVVGRWEGRLQDEAPDLPYIVPPKGALARIDTESLWMMLKLPAIVRELRPDVIFFPSNGLMAVAAALKLRLGRACPPMVLRISNNLDLPQAHPLVRWLNRRLLRLHSHIYAAIVGMAPPVREEILREMAPDPARVVTIDNAALSKADLTRFAAARDATRRDHVGRHFLAVGRLAPQKNFELLLDAFARIAKDEDRLVIVGEGDERDALLRRARQLGLQDRVHLPGHQLGMESYFAEADAFILSSDFEGFGNVLVEALAAGIPIVATNCGPAVPVLVNNMGRIVPPRDVTALASAMNEICSDQPDIAAMRSRASRFTLEATATKWSELFNQIAGK